jgi:hypothetical protein
LINETAKLEKSKKDRVSKIRGPEKQTSRKNWKIRKRQQQKWKAEKL